jgi:hypothetical protein
MQMQCYPPVAPVQNAAAFVQIHLTHESSYSPNEINGVAKKIIGITITITIQDSKISRITRVADNTGRG